MMAVFDQRATPEIFVLCLDALVRRRVPACRVFSLRQGDEHSVLGGVEEVPVNPLEPGEEQTVTVMQQAPGIVSTVNTPQRWETQSCSRGRGISHVLERGKTLPQSTLTVS